MARTQRTPKATAAAVESSRSPAAALPAVADFAGLAAEWQRLASGAWSDLGRQADTGRTEIAEVQWPAQAWMLQMELLGAQTSRLARLFEETLAAGLDLQTRWFKQFETLGLNGLQSWLPAEGHAGGLPTGAFGAWAEWPQQMLAALRHDVEGGR